MKARLLVADDDAELAQLVADIARDERHEVVTVTSVAAALAEIERAAFDVVITDVRMPRASGIDLIERLRSRDPRIVTIAMTAFGSIDTAVEAMRAGAFDYIVKPFRPDEMSLRIQRAVDKRLTSLELVRLRDEAAGRFSIAGIVGKSAALQGIATLVRRVADSSATVLVTGPSGSGKELVARALHAESKRHEGPFVAVNCAAIPEPLVEAELFGVKKGAFTDATRDRPGLFREAHGGTLLLDEVGELPAAAQAKLLRVLQEREVRAVGGATSDAVDVRVVAATNVSLRDHVARKTFREDLFYRLAVIEIAVPPLRERPEDVLPLATHFVARAASRAGRPAPAFSESATKLLLEHPWPGNVRELENAIERAMALCDDKEGASIEPEHLPDPVRAKQPADWLDAAADHGMTLEEVQRAYAELVLTRAGGNKHKAAQALGVDRRTLQRWFGAD